jgi:ABC-type transport system substrate-binding protein
VGSITTLDPARAGWTVESRVIEQIAEGLTDVDASLQIRAALADTWEVTDGGRTFRFRLRKGATLGDGRPLRSDDVAAALTRLAAPGDLAGWGVMADVAAPPSTGPAAPSA